MSDNNGGFNPLDTKPVLFLLLKHACQLKPYLLYTRWIPVTKF